MLYGLMTIGLAVSRQYWMALVCWALLAAGATLWNITAGSLGQMIVPNELLGRVTSFARVLAWGAIPISALIGGALIEWTKNVALVYGWRGGLTCVIIFGFASVQKKCSPLAALWVSRLATPSRREHDTLRVAHTEWPADRSETGSNHSDPCDETVPASHAFGR